MIRPTQRQAGFSLLELTIAMAIIAFALFAILSMTLHTASEKEAMRELQTAKEAANRKVEEIRGLAWGSLSSPVFPSVVNTYASGTAGPFLVDGLTWDVPVSYDPLNTTTFNPQKKGMGKIIIHGVQHSGGTFPPTAMTDPVYLVDYEITVEWRGVRGRSKYSARMMVAKDQGK